MTIGLLSHYSEHTFNAEETMFTSTLDLNYSVIRVLEFMTLVTLGKLHVFKSSYTRFSKWESKISSLFRWQQIQESGVYLLVSFYFLYEVVELCFVILNPQVSFVQPLFTQFKVFHTDQFDEVNEGVKGWHLIIKHHYDLKVKNEILNRNQLLNQQI